jgi:hypothetical protein
MSAHASALRLVAARRLQLLGWSLVHYAQATERAIIKGEPHREDMARAQHAGAVERFKAFVQVRRSLRAPRVHCFNCGCDLPRGCEGVFDNTEGCLRSRTSTVRVERRQLSHNMPPGRVVIVANCDQDNGATARWILGIGAVVLMLTALYGILRVSP